MTEEPAQSDQVPSQPSTPPASVGLLESVAISTTSVPRKVLWLHAGVAGLTTAIAFEVFLKEHKAHVLWVLPAALGLSLVIMHFRVRAGNFDD